MLFEFLVSFLVISVVYHLVKGFKKPNNFPPGPTKYPIIGNNLKRKRVGEGMEEVIERLIPKYGDIIGFYVGSRPFVYINEPMLARKLFNMEVFSGRPSARVFTEVRHPRGLNKILGVISTDGSFWAKQKKFTLRALKDFGFGKRNSENVIQEEASNIVEHLLQHNNKSIEIKNTFNVPIINVLWQMVASMRYSLDDPEAEEIMNYLTKIFSNSSSSWLNQYRTIVKLFPSLTTLQIRKEAIGKLFNQFYPAIKEHKQTLDAENPRDFIDMYLLEIAKTKDPDFNEDQMVSIILDLFFAGAETTSTTLKWALLFLTLHPEVQDRCHEEIIKTIGQDQTPSLAHLDQLSYCLATIYEIQRKGSTLSQSLPHRTMDECTVEGFKFPKRTIVFANIHYFMSSSRFWKNPEQFNPSRFLTKDGKIRKDLDMFIPFSVGRRVCMGESLAKNELFLFFVFMMQRVKFHVSEQHPAPDATKYKTGITRVPTDFHVKITAV